MGGSQSSPKNAAIQESIAEGDEEEPRITISNRMVERLVEDAAAVSRPVLGCLVSPQEDFNERVYIEKLKCIDDRHSEQTGLTLSVVESMLHRIERRCRGMVRPERVCADCERQVQECYDSPDYGEHYGACWEKIAAFQQCVQSAASERLRAGAAAAARRRALRSREVARARRDMLRDLAPPPPAQLEETARG